MKENIVLLQSQIMKLATCFSILLYSKITHTLLIVCDIILLNYFWLLFYCKMLYKLLCSAIRV